MSHTNRHKMDDLDQIDEGNWQGIDETTDDPEEARVMFCALDSFLSVYPLSHSKGVLGHLHCSYSLCCHIIASSVNGNDSSTGTGLS